MAAKRRRKVKKLFTLKRAKSLLSRYGMSLTKKDGEYRVNFKKSRNEGPAYYTDDIHDAVTTGYRILRGEG